MSEVTVKQFADTVGVGVDRVVRIEADADFVVLGDDVRDERVAQIREALLPLRVLDPGKDAAGPDAEAEPRRGVVFHPDMRKVKVSEPVLGIERDQKRSVADR